MIDQKEGETDFTIKIHYDDMVRSYYKKNTITSVIICILCRDNITSIFL